MAPSQFVSYGRGSLATTKAPVQPAPVPDNGESLVLDLLDWVGSEPRPYVDVLEAWR